MSDHPEVSIILPVYNKEPFLRETLKYIFRQTFSDWELIAIDDGSTDASGKILDVFAAKDCRMQVFHQENAGVSASRNRGIRLAAGEWIWFVDGDDLPEEEFLEAVFARQLWKGADVIAGNFKRQYPDGRVQRVETQSYGIFTGRTFPEVFMREQYETGFWGYLWNKLFRRKILLHSEIFFREELTLAEDLEFLTRLYRSGISIRTIPVVSMTYRMMVACSLSGGKIDYRHQMFLLRMIRKWILSVKPSAAYEKKFSWLMRTCAVCLVLEERAECEEEIWKGTARKLAADPLIGPALVLFPWKRQISPAAWCIRRGRYRLLELFLQIRELMSSYWHRRKLWLDPADGNEKRKHKK